MNLNPSQQQQESKPFDAAIQRRLIEYRQATDATISDLARELGVNSALVSKYLSGRPVGDVARLESLIEDMLKTAALRETLDVELFPTSISRQMSSKLEFVRKQNSVSLIHGPAGIGKTCGIELYVRSNPTTIAIRAKRWRRDAGGIVALLFEAVENRGWNGKVPRMEWLSEKLRSSNRLIVVDNAHRLTTGSLEVLFDFHDETGCPVALIGNPEIGPRIRANDQMNSRLGISSELTLKDPADVVKKLLTQIVPEACDELAPLAEVVIERSGHLRALVKQIRLAAELVKSGGLAWGKAFLSAHALMPRDYKLEF